MYKQYFNFNADPFSIAPDPYFIYLSEQHQDGLAHLLYGINYGGGFIVLTGEVGTGKTMLCHCLLQELPKNVEIALALNPKLNSIELLASICDELQIAYDKNSPTLKGLVDSLNAHLLTAHANGKNTVLIIDEAQNLSLDVLEQVRLLTNLETSKTKLLQIILIGQPELRELLARPELRQLNQRITARYHLMPLSYTETKKYIRHRLVICGGRSDIFNEQAIKRVYKVSKGIPRVINVICDKALLGAYASDTEFVTVKIVNQAIKEVLDPSFSPKRPYLITVFIGLLVAGLLSAAVYLFNKLPVKQQTTLAIPLDHQKEEHTPRLTKNHEAVSDFSLAINTKKVILDTVLYSLAEIWDKEIPQGFSCDELEVLGLICLFGQSDWKSLIAMNRPVIMEFSLSKDEKNYMLLTGVKEGKPIFQKEGEKPFPLDDVLSQWDGYYLMLWKTPMRGIKIISPKESSRIILWIRKHLALTHEYYLSERYSVIFDDELKTEIIHFQDQHNLTTDGIVGPQTFIHLQNNDPQGDSPKLNLVP